MKIQMVSVPVQDPVKAHRIYTTHLGFRSLEFDETAQLAIVVSPEDPDGTQLLLEPCVGTFAEAYQQAAFEANLPVMIFSTRDVELQKEKLLAAGVRLRPDLDRPDWGLTNLFEDGCGNYLMFSEEATS